MFYKRKYFFPSSSSEHLCFQNCPRSFGCCKLNCQNPRYFLPFSNYGSLCYLLLPNISLQIFTQMRDRDRWFGRMGELFGSSVEKPTIADQAQRMLRIPAMLEYLRIWYHPYLHGARQCSIYISRHLSLGILFPIKKRGFWSKKYLQTLLIFVSHYRKFFLTILSFWCSRISQDFLQIFQACSHS